MSGSGIGGNTSTPEITTYQWDLAGRLLAHTTTVAVTAPNTGQRHATQYEHDAAGRLAARHHSSTDAATNQPLGSKITQRYGYDNLERLAQIKYIKNEGAGNASGEQLIEQIDYGYDAGGRRTSKTTLNGNGAGGTGAGQETPFTASYDTANRMSAISLQISGQTKSYTLSYDSNGNLTQKQNTSDASDRTIYSWDASNRLSQISQSNANAAQQIAATFLYDAFGRRIQASITKGTNTPDTVQYLYEGAQALGEIRNGNLTHRLLTGISLDETIARIAINTTGSNAGQADNANTRIYITDALNSVIASLANDTNANIQTSYGYSPYGQTEQIGPDNTNNPNQYTSRENDQTGLMFYRARYYDPVLKRFISEDPIGLAGGMNFHVFVDGDPISLTDPLGLVPDGHHWVIGPIRNDPNLSPAAAQVFKDAKTGPVPGGHNFGDGHSAYNKGVNDLWKKYIDQNKINPAAMTKLQADDFVSRVKTCDDPRVRDFNRKIYDKFIRAGFRRMPPRGVD